MNKEVCTLKSFDDFVKLLNSDDFQKSLSEIPLNIEEREYNLLNMDDLMEISHSIEEATLNRVVKILRKYHEWSSENQN